MTLIVGFAGRKGHGKDTAAAVLVDNGFTVIKFASGIKKIARAFFTYAGFKEEELFDLTEGSRKEEVLSVLASSPHASVDLFDRFVAYHHDLLQEVLGISLFDVDYPPFTGNTSREFQQYIGTEIGRTFAGEKVWTNAAIREAKQYSKVVITDVRFPNEVTAITDEGGVVFRVKRENVGDTGFSDHPSEAFIDTLDVVAEIPNNGTIHELHERVKDLVL